ncbi:hypothetical protein GCM10011512_02420 [Tersicoccus solisilvae]|uniref:Aminoglycoside phosphotransferase domain-containing protein n=1 Tax=Tersicoccus solisilvae TaxID=1882339 RepID=A0ABQ1NK57_9MICC|nr:aminoglycoside phosphotransferase family protein [Tersicoccus solisilvae]GGC79287.1 hypothetical protein GCM10011512_02420 [Tersicoccus solisilvae]
MAHPIATAPVTDAVVADVIRAVTAATGRPAYPDARWRPPVQGAVGHLLGLRLAGRTDADDADLLVAKLFPPAVSARAATEATALTAAAVLGDEVPRAVVAGRLAGGTGFLVMTRLPGDRWADVRPALSPADAAAVVAQVGSVAGRLHAVTGEHFGALADDGDGGPTPRRWATSRGWTTALVERTLAAFDAAGGDPVLATGVERLAAASLLDDAVPPSLCHQDLNGGNILLRRDPGSVPVISGLVDFERAEWADPAHDLALTVVHLMHEGEADLVPVLLDAHGGMDPAARSRLALHVVLRMTAEWAWVATDRPADWRHKTVTLAGWIRART